MAQPDGELDKGQPAEGVDKIPPSAVDRVASSLREGLPQSVLLAQTRADRRGPRPYTPPTAALRSEARQALHDRALQDIARLRFAFPSAKYPYYRTYVNHPQRTMGVEMAERQRRAA